jgi:hypothetical protein
MAAAVAAAGAAPAAAAQVTTVRVSIASNGAPANRAATAAVISADGHTVAFDSAATNLSVRADTNGATDVFARDLRTGITRRVSVAGSGAQARGRSHVIAISSDGNLVLFSSAANLVRGDRNRQPDVFVRNVARRTTTRVDLGPGGIEPEGVQPQFPGCCSPIGLDMSPDGRFVLYAAGDPNLLHGRCCLGIFLRDRKLHTTTTIAVNQNFVAAVAARVTDGGRFVAYSIGGIGFTDFPGKTFLLDRRTGMRTRIGASVGDGSIVADIAGGGRYVLFTSYLLGTADSEVFLYDHTAGTTTHVNVSAAAPYTTHTQAGSVSANGRFATFVSRYPGYVSGDTAGRTDVFRRDVTGATTTRMSLSAAGAQLTHDSAGGAMSASGAAVVFLTAAAAVPGDTDAVADVFLRLVP